MRRVGDYEILGKLGEGGMGVVYRARRREAALDGSSDPATTNRTAATVGDLVALKLLHPEIQDDVERRARFLREAQLASAFSHPNVVAVRDFGEVHLDSLQRTLYLAQELVPGRDLYTRAELDALPQRRIVDACAQVASGLAAAHAVGVVHRDVKPTNVLYTRDGAAKLLDFGLARWTEDAEPSVADPSSNRLAQALDFRTAVGTSLGTAGYSAPEQLEGAPPHPAADLYALGVTLYQLLAGRMPYRADTLGELRSAVLAPPAPLGTLDVAAPDGFDEYLRELLQPEPERRPADADEVARQLLLFAREWPDDETIEAPELTETGIVRLKGWLANLRRG